LAYLEKRQKVYGVGAIFETPKQSENLEKSEKARQLDARLHPPVSLFPCIKGFLRGIRKKVPKLLYHSLGTNVGKELDNDTLQAA